MRKDGVSIYSLGPKLAFGGEVGFFWHGEYMRKEMMPIPTKQKRNSAKNEMKGRNE